MQENVTPKLEIVQQCNKTYRHINCTFLVLLVGESSHN